MKTTLRNPLKIVGVLALSLASITTTSAQNNTTFSVLELFTSEGCSSCPSADDMLNSAAATADNNTYNHLFLALHIEYWDYLGWTDQYANSAHDNMFFDYYNSGNGIQIISGNSFGTPIFVRNGEEGRNYSTQVQNKQATAYIDMNYVDQIGDQLTVDYTLTGDLVSAQARFFLVESNITSYVTAGENNGSTLLHNNVVRDMEIIGVTANTESGTVTFTVPANANLANMRVMAYIRKQKNSPWTREIIGATKGFKLNNVGLKESQNLSSVEMYPNPSSKNVVITSEEVIKTVEIIDALGNTVDKLQFNKSEIVLDINSLIEGMYFLKIETDAGASVEKLIKES